MPAGQGKMIVCTGLAALAAVSTNLILCHKVFDPVCIKWKNFADLGTSPWRDGIGKLDIDQ